MPLATMKEVMDYARAETRGVGMFNVVGLEYAEAITEAAEELDFPVILGLPAPFLDWHKSEIIANVMLDAARKATVPVAVHLDHGSSFEIVMRALRLGFTSVMFDGSSLPFEENVRQTAEIVRIAHAMGVTVEGELGYLGFAEGAEVLPENLTKPEEASAYVERTGVDALAIAIGNIHGHYKGTPCLDYARLKEIRGAVDCALVLHGGSGLSDDDFRQVVRDGITKINIFTHMNDAAGQYLVKAAPEGRPWYLMAGELKNAVKESVKSFIRVFGRLSE